MSGQRLLAPRKGDVDEYRVLAILNEMGSALLVPRQEDIGVDFYCQLSQVTGNTYTLNHPYSIQLKPASYDKLVLGNIVDGKYRTHEIQWLFSLGQPFFLAFYEHAPHPKLRIYSTSAMWGLRYLKGPVGGVTFVRDKPFAGHTPIISTPFPLVFTSNTFGDPVIDSSGGVLNDGTNYEVALGFPVLTWEQGMSKKDLELQKYGLKSAIAVETRNIIYRNLGTLRGRSSTKLQRRCD